MHMQVAKKRLPLLKIKVPTIIAWKTNLLGLRPPEPGTWSIREITRAKKSGRDTFHVIPSRPADVSPPAIGIHAFT